MITFENGLDHRTREPLQPAVAKFRIVTGDGKPREYRYIIIGTQYGYLHTTGGVMRTWQTASGARKALQRYIERGPL